MSNKLNGLYLGSRKCIKDNKTFYLSRFLVWEGVKNNSLENDDIAVVFSDSAESIIPLTSVFVFRDFRKDFKTGQYRPIYTGFELREKK